MSRIDHVQTKVDEALQSFREWWPILLCCAGAIWSVSTAYGESARTKQDVSSLRQELTDHKTEVQKIRADVNEIKVTSARSEAKLDLLLQGKR